MNLNCRKCRTTFPVTQRHLEFYEKVSPKFAGKVFSVPPPSLCPECRQQRRMSWRSERNLFARNCSKTSQRMIGMYVPETDFPVYEGREWWSESNDATQFGRDVDFGRPIFPQLRELQNEVPRMQMFTYALDRLENSDYANCCGDLKDCYMVFCSGRNERCYYSTALVDCYQTVDCLFARHATNCYECIDIESCNGLSLSQCCTECHDSAFLFDCRGCTNCLFSANLRHQKYHIFNQPYSAKEFERIKNEIFNGSFSALEAAKERFSQFLLTVPRRHRNGINNENVSGDYVSSSKNCEHCFDTSNSEDCSFCTWFLDGKDCMDFYSWGEAELCYEVSGGGDKAYHNMFSAMGSGLRSSFYTDHCQYCKNCIACVGLKNKEHCILNKQYSPVEYEKLAARLVEHMINSGEWGEFFPASAAPFAYNHSVAAEYYPLSRDEALSQGFLWSDYSPPQTKTQRIIPAAHLVDLLSEAPEDLLQSGIECAESSRLFRIVKEELEFYRRNNFPLPRFDSKARHSKRVAARNPRRIWDRQCFQCEVEISTSYAPGRPEEVLCEACYNSTVY